MDKNEKLKLGDIFLAPKEFFLNNSVGNIVSIGFFFQIFY